MQKNERYRRLLTRLVITAIITAVLGIPVPKVYAAQLTTMSDNMSRLAATTLSDHTVQFITPTGITAFGQTMTINFNSFTTVTNVTAADVNLDVSAGGSCSSFSSRTVQSSAGSDIWGVGAATTIVTLTAPSSGTIGTSGVPAGRCVQVKIGSNAGGAARITNPGSGTATISVTVNGTSTDTGTIAVPIITNDQVSLTATVSPTITFTLSQNSLGFGTLATANGRWATNGGGAATPTTGLQITVATNGTAGYSVYVLGPTLTSGGDTITALGSSTASSPNSEQFGINGAIGTTGSGTPAVSSPFNTTNQYAHTATSTVQVQFASNDAPDSGTIFDVKYLANIAGSTEAGSYAAIHTWTGTGNF